MFDPQPRHSDVISLFERTFRYEPRIVTSAPGRVNLIGEHTDYNGGQVWHPHSRRDIQDDMKGSLLSSG